MFNCYFIYMYLFFIGSVIGSFIGLAVDRLPHQLQWRENYKENWNIFYPRSQCDHCETKIKWFSLIPVFGYLFSLGHCTSCNKKVSWIYPVTEVFCGTLLIVIFNFYGINEKSIIISVLAMSLFFLAWIDINENWLPAVVTIPLFWLGLLCSPFCLDAFQRIEGAAFGFFLPLLAMWIVSLMKKSDVIAGGDIALITVAGAWFGLDKMLVYILSSNLFFAAYAIPARIKGKVFVPMGPALVFGFIYCIL